MKRAILVLFSIVCVFTLMLFAIFNFGIYPKKYKNFVSLYSERYGLDSALVYAIIKTESNFNPQAKSSAGAVGLMQLMPSTAKWVASVLGEDYDENNLKDAETNIRYGCYYLSYLFEKFKDDEIVICAYNAGETVVRNWLDNGRLDKERIAFAETKNYLSKVKSYYNVYVTNEMGM